MSRTLQEQIGQALGPAMAEFREQMAASVRRELDQTLQREPRRAPTNADRPSAQGQNQAAGRDQEPDRDQERVTDQGRDRDQERATDRGRDKEPDRGREQGQAASGESDDASAPKARAEDAEPSAGRGGQSIRALLSKPLLEAIPGILEHQGEQWLRARLDLGIDIAFSTWVRGATQHEAERILQRATGAAISLLPDRAARDDLRTQSDQTVTNLVRTAFDRLFSDDVRDDLKERGHRAIGALFQPDLKGVVHQVQDLLLALIEGALAVLRECLEQILQLLGRVVVALLQSRLTGLLKNSLASLMTSPGREGKKNGTDSVTASEDEDNKAEPRQALTEPAEDPPRDDARERGKAEQRDRESGASSGEGDRAEQRPSREPSGRSPAARPTPTRQPPGGSLSDRPGPGRSSRTTSR